jgi:hypothetical protein
MKLALVKRNQQTVPMRTPRFESLDFELQECVAQAASRRNMTPQEFLNDLYNPDRPKISMKEFIDSLDTSRMGTFTQEELFEVLDEVRRGH